MYALRSCHMNRGGRDKPLHFTTFPDDPLTYRTYVCATRKLFPVLRQSPIISHRAHAPLGNKSGYNPGMPWLRTRIDPCVTSASLASVNRTNSAKRKIKDVLMFSAQLLFMGNRLEKREPRRGKEWTQQIPGLYCKLRLTLFIYSGTYLAELIYLSSVAIESTPPIFHRRPKNCGRFFFFFLSSFLSFFLSLLNVTQWIYKACAEHILNDVLTIHHENTITVKDLRKAYGRWSKHSTWLNFLGFFLRK